MSESGIQSEIPPVEVPARSQVMDARLEEKGAFDPGLLDHNLRRLAAYGALFAAAILFLSGLCVVFRFAALAALHPEQVGGLWHIFLTMCIALFSVPTFLLFAVLRHAKPSPADDLSDGMLHTAIGEKVMEVVEKFLLKRG